MRSIATAAAFAGPGDDGSCANGASGWNDRARISTAPAGCAARTSAVTRMCSSLWLHAGAANLGLLMRTAFGVGTPRSLQGHAAALTALLWTLWDVLVPPIRALDQLLHSVSPRLVLEGHAVTGALVLLPVTPFTTDC